MGQKSFVDRDYNSVNEAYFSVLQQLEIAALYIEEHLYELRRDNIGLRGMDRERAPTCFHHMVDG
jgi:hypothetical protein